MQRTAGGQQAVVAPKVGAGGFEPPTPCTPCRGASRAAPRPARAGVIERVPEIQSSWWADILTVQRLLGRADPRTTSRYDRRPEEAKRQAVAKLHVPYRGRH